MTNSHEIKNHIRHSTLAKDLEAWELDELTVLAKRVVESNWVRIAARGESDSHSKERRVLLVDFKGNFFDCTLIKGGISLIEPWKDLMSTWVKTKGSWREVKG